MFCHFVRSAVAVISLNILLLPAAVKSEGLTDAEAKKFFGDHRCNACHAVKENRIGPAYLDVSYMYGDAPPDVVNRLGMKIIHGGAGSWGNVPMISNPKVSFEEAQAIVRWILKLQEAEDVSSK